MQTNQYGLVAGKILRSFDIYKGGTLAGFEPAVAARLIAKGLFKPTSAENEVIAKADIVEKAVVVEGEGNELLIGLESGTLKIPLNWRDQHHTKKKAWAAQISGSDVKGVPEADEIIAEAVKDQEAALDQT